MTQAAGSRPFYQDPHWRNASILFGYSKREKTMSHVGLGVNCMHSVNVLRRLGIKATAVGANTADEFRALLAKDPSLTHIVIEAPRLAHEQLEQLVYEHPDVTFTVRVHSQPAFLQIEPNAIRLIRDAARFQLAAPNLRLSANSHRFCEFMQRAYGVHCLFLPNLYNIQRVEPAMFHGHTHRDTLRIASLGALRLQKHHVAAAGAALEVARRMGCNLDFYLNVGRNEGGGGSILQAIRNMFADLPGTRLVEIPWAPWVNFRETVSHLDLCIHLSSSETFNLCTADALAEHVPCVVGPAIEWAPQRWKADIDDVGDAARVALFLLSDPQAGREGYRALQNYQQSALRTWVRWLNRSPLEYSTD